MTQEDLDFIKNYQAWRRGAEIPQPNPTEIGIALDKLIAYCEMCMKLNENSYTTK
jgi:hypothetical protein